ncbi:hypothetical protein [Burkholderia phage FLC9]|nr:hypothetical protein [Burkholderia phage FLC9]
MVDISRVKRIAFDYVARVYVANHVETELLDDAFGAWYYKQLQRYDPCGLAEISVALTEARRFEVPGFGTPQYGHVFIVTFDNYEEKVVKTQVSEVFLRLSELGKIVELLPFRQTIH